MTTQTRPGRMYAVLIETHGGPEVLQGSADVLAPEPQRNECLVQVTAAAVNNTDIWTREGAYGTAADPSALSGWRGPVEFPRIQGGDVAGVVTAVGSDGDPQLIGRRVLIDPSVYPADGDDVDPVGVIGSEVDGGFAQYVVIPPAQIHDVSGSPLTDAQLACVPVAYGTAMGMLERAGLKAGERVLVTGASGGVGLALVQLAAARGAQVIALTSAGKEDVVRLAGATAAIDRSAEDLLDRVRAEAPAGLEVVADVVGGDLLGRLMPAVNDSGRWVIAGAMGGATIQLDLRRLYLHNIRLIGSSMHTRKHFRALVAEVNRGAFTPVVAATYPMSQMVEAQAAFASPGRAGKIVVLPAWDDRGGAEVS